MSYDELIELNQRVVARLKFLNSMAAHKEMMRFSPGEKVSFMPPGREEEIGTLVKYNRKTVTIITESGNKWNVSPHLLRRVKNVEGDEKDIGNLLTFKKK